MSENYSNEIIDLKNRARKLLDVMSQKDIFTEEEIAELEKRSNAAIENCVGAIDDDVALALAITNGGLVYKTDENNRYFFGITKALLAKTVETAYQEKSDFMERDEGKQPAIYETFANEYFDEMFGKKGYRQLFSGDGKEFLKDFMRYGATIKEIADFDKIITGSVNGADFNINDSYVAKQLCEKVKHGRQVYESVPQEYLEKPIKKAL